MILQQDPTRPGPMADEISPLVSLPIFALISPLISPLIIHLFIPFCYETHSIYALTLKTLHFTSQIALMVEYDLTVSK